MPDGGDSRDRVEYAHRRRMSQAVADRVEDFFHVADKPWHVVGFQSVSRVLPVIALIVEHEVETIRKQAPKRHIRVDGEAVAVAQDQTRTFGVAVPTNADGGSVSHREIECLVWRGDDQGHCESFLLNPYEGWPRATPVRPESTVRRLRRASGSGCRRGGLGGNEGGVVSGVFNLESSDVEASVIRAKSTADRRAAAVIEPTTKSLLFEAL